MNNYYPQEASHLGMQGMYGSAGNMLMAPAMHNDQYLNSYAGPVVQEKRTLIAGQRRRLNIVPICLCLFLPCILFIVMFTISSSTLHYHSSHPFWIAHICAFLYVAAVGIFAAKILHQKLSRRASREPSWWIFLFLTSLLAYVAGWAGGDVDYRFNTAPFMDIMLLNRYVSVDPARMRGQQLMDAGRIIFSENSHLDFSKIMAFVRTDTFCVVPIVTGNGTQGHYDFWAVGTNCCSATSPFHCGESSNHDAHGGMRLMHDEQRPYFRLAVQQAEAAYKIAAPHPLFFTWMQDPDAHVNSFRESATSYLYLGVLSHFILQLFLVIVAALAFSKLGHM